MKRAESLAIGQQAVCHQMAKKDCLQPSSGSRRQKTAPTRDPDLQYTAKNSMHAHCPSSGSRRQKTASTHHPNPGGRRLPSLIIRINAVENCLPPSSGSNLILCADPDSGICIQNVEFSCCRVPTDTDSLVTSDKSPQHTLTQNYLQSKLI